MLLDIQHLPDRGRFQAVVDGQTCVADYRLSNGVMAITHTEVAPQLEGQGIAGQLVQAVLDHAQANGLKVSPLCSYARVYMRRHPQTQALLP
ncbi:GNAT family N-acetyltransferase [soil metagenome]